MDKKILVEKIIYSILSVIWMGIGVFFIARPEQSTLYICQLVGIILILYGGVKIFGYFLHDMYQLAFQFDFATGIFSALIGVLLVARTEHVYLLLTTFISVFIIMDGLLKIQIALDARRFGLNKWWIILGLAIIVSVVGILLLIKPVLATDVAVGLIGLNLLFNGILNLWVILYTVKSTRISNNM